VALADALAKINDFYRLVRNQVRIRQAEAQAQAMARAAEEDEDEDDLLLLSS
jgi:hypothetical protein